MFCPKCGQEQATEVPNFCSRCGFPLTQVTSLLERGGAPGDTQENKPRAKTRRFGLWLLRAAFALLVLSLFSAAADGDLSAAIFGFLTFVSFLIGICILIYYWLKGRTQRRSESVPLGHQTSHVEAPERGALPASAPSLDTPRGRFDTGEVAEPPSVTEHTTRQLKHDGSRERERIRSFE